jgi:arylsulfatase
MGLRLNFLNKFELHIRDSLPSRAALMTAQYSIRNGLSLVIVAGTDATLSAHAYTMATCSTTSATPPPFSASGTSAPNRRACRPRTASTSSTVPPDISWDSCTYVDTITLTHSFQAPDAALLEKGPHIVEGELGGKLREVKPFTPAVRPRSIRNWWTRRAHLATAPTLGVRIYL